MTQTAPFVKTFGPFCSAWVERWRARKQRTCCAVASSHLRRQERLATLVVAVHAHGWLGSIQSTANTLPVRCNSLCVRAVVGIVYTLTWIPFSDHGRARWLAAAVVAAAGLQVSAAPCWHHLSRQKLQGVRRSLIHQVHQLQAWRMHSVAKPAMSRTAAFLPLPVHPPG